MTPKDQRSTAFVYESLDILTCWPKRRRSSGAVYAGVPAKVRIASGSSLARLLILKSAIFTHQSGPLQTTAYSDVQIQSACNYCLLFAAHEIGLTAGFISRWANPLACMYCRPSRVWWTISCVSLSTNGFPGRRYFCKSPFGRHSIAIYILDGFSYQPKDLTKHWAYCKFDKLKLR